MILHAVQSLKGGPASYFDEIIPDQIDRYGQENVALCVPDADLTYLSDRSREARIFSFPSRERSLRSLRDFHRAFRHSVRQFQPDIVHLHSSFAGAMGRMALLGTKRRPRVVYCSHGWAFDMKGGKSGALGTAVALVERALATQADSIANISQADQSSALKRGIGRGKSRVILNGVADLPVPALPKEAQQRALGMDPAKINLLFVGRFDQQKGVDIAVAAIRDLDPARYHLYLIGDYVVSARPGEGEADLASLPMVSLLGWKDRSALPPWFAAADALLMPSRWEGFGLAAIEAMRMQTAVVASRAGALPELVVDGHTGRLVPPDSHPALNQTLLSETKAGLHAYGRAGRERFEQLFTSARLNRELAALYAELV
jgi:glycosyltransferase involved in cell wall biosynthesis